MQIIKDELFISQLFHAQPDAVLWVKPVCKNVDGKHEVTDFEVIYCNKAGSKLTIFNEHDILGKHYKRDEVLGGSAENAAFEQCLKVLVSGISEDFTYYNSASKKYFNATRIKVNEGILSIVRDITTEVTEKDTIHAQSEVLKRIIEHSEKAQVEIERSAAKLRKFIDSAHSGMSYFLPITDENGNITDFRFDIINTTFAAYSGAFPEEVMGQPLSKWQPSYKENGLFEKYKQTCISGQTAKFETHYKSEGSDSWFDNMVVKMDDGILVTTTDLTTVKKLQINLETSVKDLKRSNANLQEFAYVASHDLQEPLRKIQVFADRLKKDIPSLTAENQNVFDRMITATKRMSQLINDLLAYSQLSTKKAEFKMVDLTDIVQQVVSDLEASITDKGATITFQNLPQVKGDPVQLRQLFQNLISNSLKYCQPDINPVINISSAKAGRDENNANRGYNKIEISDNGIGFEQQNAERIFKVFQRLHGRSEYPGTGIGLAIVHKVVENHKGSITAESEPEKGAVFTLHLPA